ncbi:MAG: adenosylcobinamide-phosphate synthase CbiB [Acidobacteria bacterium]|nr:adenosylcobinamide-phosphate synthase CbiB [Acidobacteriota bacterium]
MDLSGLAPRADLLVLALALDLAFGDPSYRWHPVRLVGGLLVRIERALRAAGANGRGGGCVLFAVLAVAFGGGAAGVVVGARAVHPGAAQAVHLFLLYSLIALGDLLAHAGAVDAAARAGDLHAARAAAARLVGRDTDRMDLAACRRSAMESLGESLVDGVVSPIFWYCVAGLPGILVFKVVSTMDSMVGYKTERYRRFGWCGARLDDLLNLIPARVSWLLVAAAAVVVPGASGREALRCGWWQHAVVPGPNAGWSEAALAGAIRRRLAGPIWSGGRLVTEVWIGEANDPPGGSADDYRRARRTTLAAAGLAAALAIGVLLAVW